MFILEQKKIVAFFLFFVLLFFFLLFISKDKWGDTILWVFYIFYHIFWCFGTLSFFFFFSEVSLYEFLFRFYYEQVCCILFILCCEYDDIIKCNAGGHMCIFLNSIYFSADNIDHVIYMFAIGVCYDNPKIHIWFNQWRPCHIGMCIALMVLHLNAWLSLVTHDMDIFRNDTYLLKSRT